MPHKVCGSKQTAYSTAAATIMNDFSKPQLEGSMLILSTVYYSFKSICFNFSLDWLFLSYRKNKWYYCDLDSVASKMQ